MSTVQYFQKPSQIRFDHFHQKQIIQGHILKFIKKGKLHQDRGIICFPQQTYGNSQQSPNTFKGKHGLTPQNGYYYRHQNKPQFKYYSQKRYFSIDGSTKQDQSKHIHNQDPQNIVKFHKKKGKLSQFMDKNGWMNKTTKLMGFQRDQNARQLLNIDRKKRIQALKPRINYENKTAKRPDTSAQYFRTMGGLTSRKMKIRSQRNIQAQKFSSSIQPRNIQTSHKTISKLDRQTIEQKMLQSAREWSPSRDNKSKCDEFVKTFYGTRLNGFENNVNKQKNLHQYSWRQNHQQTLEDWYRTTCNSKWIYNKKLQSGEHQNEPSFPGVINNC